MAWTLLSHTKIGNGTTPAINTSGASLLVVWETDNAGPTAPTDSAGNTWTALTAPTQNTGTSNIYYVASPTTSASHTFTPQGSFPALCVAAFSGGATSPFEAQDSGNSGTGTTIQPGSLTPAENGALLITGYGGANNGSSSINSSFTITDEVALAGGSNYGVVLAYLIQSTAAAVNPTWTEAGGGQTLMAVFAPPVGPANPTVIENPTGMPLHTWAPIAM